MKFFIVTFFIIISYSLKGQTQTIEGILKDSLTEKGVPYIHILINSDIGTISNNEGEFKLTWNKSIEKNPVLRFSGVGYKTLVMPINDSILTTYLEVKLVPSITILDDVLITSDSDVDSTLLIMQKVLKNINKNYPTHKYGMEAFYREANISDDIYSRMIEAQLYIADKGYKKPIETVEMNVMQLRKTEDNRDISWRQSLFEWLYMQNGAIKTLANDRFRYTNSLSPLNATELTENENGLLAYEKRGHEGNIRFLSKEFIESCDWDLENVLPEKNDTTFVLHYEVINKNKHKSFARIGKGFIYVAKSDWGVKEIRSEVVKPEGLPYIQFDYTLKDSRAYYKTIIKYQKQLGQYYLSYIKSESIGTNSQGLFGGRDRSLFKKTKGKEGKIYQVNELFVTHILPYKKVSKKNRMDKEDDLYNVDVKNNEVFWTTYNYPMLNPLTDKMKNDLKNNYGQLFIKD